MHRFAAPIPVSLAAAAMAFLPAGAPASPFDPSFVAADAAWVAHVDLDALIHSRLGVFFLENADMLDDDFNINAQLSQAKFQIGFDPLEEIFGVTAYGAGEPGDNFIIVIAGTETIARALTEATKHEEAPIVATNTGFRIDNEIEIVVVNGQGGNLYILAEQAELAQAGARVVRNRASSLVSIKDSPLLAPSTPGMLAFVSLASLPEAAGLDDDDDLNELMPMLGGFADMLNGAGGFNTFIAEHDNTATVGLSFSTRDEKQSVGLVQAINGLLGMARGMLAMQPQAADEEMQQLLGMLDGLTISAVGLEVTAALALDITTLLKLIEEEGF